MDVDKILNKARAAINADRVFATPVERDGVTVIPVAVVSGGGGGGDDGGEKAGKESRRGTGGGGGFGLHARPAGALIIGPQGQVRWKPFIDVNRIVLGGQLVGVAFFVTAWLTARSTARAAMKGSVATAAIDRLGGSGR